MLTDEVRFSLDYDGWANERLLDTIETLSFEEFTAEAAPGHAVPRATVLHCISGMRVWRERLQSLPHAGPVTEAECPTLEAARALWRAEQAHLGAYVAETDLDLVVEQRRGELVMRPPRWQFIAHLTFHNMQHRSELAQALTLFGHSPGEIGMLPFLVERSRT